MDCLRPITLFSLQLNFTVTEDHLAGLQNGVADSVSSFQMEHFRKMGQTSWPTYGVGPPSTSLKNLCIMRNTVNPLLSEIRSNCTCTFCFLFSWMCYVLHHWSFLTLQVNCGLLLRNYLAATHNLLVEFNSNLNLSTLCHLQNNLHGIKYTLGLSRRNRHPITLFILESGFKLLTPN